jgi:hypothetical protein
MFDNTHINVTAFNDPPIFNTAIVDNLATKLINGTIDPLTRDILESVVTITDKQHLYEIQNCIKKYALDLPLCSALHHKFGLVPPVMKKMLTTILSTGIVSMNDKIAFFNDIKTNGGIWDGTLLLTNPYGNIYRYMSTNPVLNFYSEDIARTMKGIIGPWAEKGQGEFLIALTGKNISFTDVGDLRINDKNIEVKSVTKSKSGSYNGGRLYSSCGYGSNTTTKKQIAEYFEVINLPLSVRVDFGIHGNNSQYIGGINLNASGLKNLSHILSTYCGYSDTVAIFKIIMYGLYNNITDHALLDLIKIINPDGSFYYNDFMIEFTKIAFDYYKSQSGHDYVLVVNVESGRYLMLTSKEDCKKYILSGVLTLTSSIDWNDDRSKGSPQLIVK